MHLVSSMRCHPSPVCPLAPDTFDRKYARRRNLVFFRWSMCVTQWLKPSWITHLSPTPFISVQGVTMVGIPVHFLSLAPIWVERVALSDRFWFFFSYHTALTHMPPIQVALCVLMAQIGCYVPADSAMLSVFDGIYTRFV